MHAIPFFSGDSHIHRLDPRLRFLFALAFSIVISLAREPAVYCSGLAIAIITASLARLELHHLRMRLLPLNIFMLFLFVLLPLGAPGETVFSIGGLAWSREGLLLALVIVLKANAVFLCYTALVSTMSPVALGHALHHLKVPSKLVQLLIFTIRYIEVVGHEYARLRRSMKIRGFQPGLNLHTLSSYGNLVGMLLVRSLDRSERVVAAMKCRGFQGRFYMLHHFALHRDDALFIVFAVALLATFGWFEWIRTII